MASTYTPIATTTGTGSSGTITFSSIPSTYTDLVLVCDIAYASLGGNTGYVNARVGNGSLDTGNNYSYTYIQGNGSSATSGRLANTNTINGLSSVTSTNRVNLVMNFQNYSNTSTYKTVIHRVNDANYATAAVVNLWRSTSAINTISVFDYSGYSFATTATFTLYGIKAA